MDTKFNIEQIQSLDLFREFEQEFGKSTLSTLSDLLMNDFKQFEEHGNFYADLPQTSLNAELKYVNRAFSEIQYKKLFNLERKWRAGKVHLDIVSSHTFDYYYELIHECPFIEPVTEAELAAYKEYLFEIEGYPEHFSASSNHAKLVMAALKNTSKYPKWYKYYDQKFNTRDLLFLEDLVFEDELRCLHKHFEQYKSVASGDFTELADGLHAITYAFETGDFSNLVASTNEKFLELAYILNDKKFAAQLQNKIEDENIEPELSLELAYYYLQSLLYAIPSIKKDYPDWRDGIYDTATEHLRMQVIKQLDKGYEDYKAGKLNNYTEETRVSAIKELDYWQGAYLDGKKKLDKG